MIPHTGRNASPAWVREYCTTAEDAGWDSLWAVDHLIMPHHTESDYTLGRKPAKIADDAVSGLLAPNYEMMTTLTWVAGFTERIKLGTAVAVLPIRNAIHNARSARDPRRLLRWPRALRRRRGVAARGGRGDGHAVGPSGRPQRGAHRAHAHALVRGGRPRGVPRRVPRPPAHGPRTAAGAAADPDPDRRPLRDRARTRRAASATAGSRHRCRPSGWPSTGRRCSSRPSATGATPRRSACSPALPDRVDLPLGDLLAQYRELGVEHVQIGLHQQSPRGNTRHDSRRRGECAAGTAHLATRSEVSEERHGTDRRAETGDPHPGDRAHGTRNRCASRRPCPMPRRCPHRNPSRSRPEAGAMSLPWDVFATPIAARKLARLGIEHDRVVLRPAFYRQLGESYGVVATASCALEGHDAPAADCSCGFYAVADESATVAPRCRRTRACGARRRTRRPRHRARSRLPRQRPGRARGAFPRCLCALRAPGRGVRAPSLRWSRARRVAGARGARSNRWPSPMRSAYPSPSRPTIPRPHRCRPASSSSSPNSRLRC